MKSSRFSRRQFLQAAIAAGAGASLAGPRFAGASGRKPPNIVLIMADDLGYECLGCNGGTSYRTPNLDRLAATGLRFTHAYTTPLCTPSRVQLMSGQYPFRNGWNDGLWELPRRQQVVDPKLIDIGARLKRANYATAVAGKWQLCLFRYHPNHPTETGFDDYSVWTGNLVTIGFGGGRPPRYWEPGIWQDAKVNRTHQKDNTFAPDVFTDFLIDFMRENRERRFFAYYPMVLPHLPVVATPDSKREFERRGKGDWLFAGMVEYIDKLVGRIVGALDDLGLREETLVIFTSDNGTDAQIISKLGNLEIPGGKGTMSWAGGHIPFIANWPGTTPPGRVCDDLTDSTDILPTLAELTGAPLPEDRRLDGRSIAPQLRGETGQPREWVHLQLRDARALRDKRWKLFQDGRLFDMVSDPLEKAPLVLGSESAEASEARARLERAFTSLK